MSNKDHKDCQQGGKYLGRGTAGCIFRPHLKCTDVSNKKNSVGKVFNDDDDYENELQMARIMARIDPKGDFSIPIIANCEGIHYYRHNDEVSKCKLINNTKQSADYKQIIYKYGGTSLQDIMTKQPGTIPRFIKLFMRLEPILEGLKKFNSRSPNAPNVVHFDIKPHNLLSLRSKLYLIDFGLLSTHEEVYSKYTTHILASDYPWYPPEFKVYLFPSSSSHKDFDKLFNRVQDNFMKVEPYIAHAITTVLKMNVKQELQAFYNDKVPKKEYIQSFANKVDIYSLGIVLLQLYVWSGYHKKKYSERSRPSKYSIARDQITELIKGMIAFDPRKRLTIDQVLAQHKRIKEHLDK
jgi:serine/threonine protein kinase